MTMVSNWSTARIQNSQKPCIACELNLELKSRSQNKAEKWEEIKTIIKFMLNN